MIDIGNYTFYLSNGVVYYTNNDLDKSIPDVALNLPNSMPIIKFKCHTHAFYFASSHEIIYFCEPDHTSLDLYRLSSHGYKAAVNRGLAREILGDINNIRCYHAIFYKFDVAISRVIEVDHGLIVQLTNYESWTLNVNSKFEKLPDFSNFGHKIKRIIKCYNRYHILTLDKKLYYYTSCDPDRIYFYEIGQQIEINTVQKLYDILILLDCQGLLFHYTRKHKLLSVDVSYDHLKIFVVKIKITCGHVMIISDNGDVYRAICDASCNISLIKMPPSNIIDIIPIINSFILVDADHNLNICGLQTYILTSDTPIKNIFVGRYAVYILYSDTCVTRLYFNHLNYTGTQSFVLSHALDIKDKYRNSTDKSARKI